MLIVSQDREKVEKMNKYYHCKTQEEYDWLMKKFDKEGYSWMNGDCLTGDGVASYWSEYEDETVIKVVKELLFADLKFYEKHETVTEFINVGELMRKESEENMPTRSAYKFLNRKIFIEGSDGVDIELQAGKLEIQSPVHKDWIKNVRRGLNLVNNILDYLESEGEDD